ncbi:MAG: hypothetical protein ABS46_08670 [Cytophagaceae bacterium SCN 52-12]|nr:MAG: hypothetical protein ABS46_08670 [Cytophagaceae bacterium SCN 52-12]
MTVETLRKYQTYLYDENGKPVMVQLDLRNRQVRKLYEQIMDKFEDLLDIQEAERRLGDNSEMIPWEEAKKSL